MKHLKKISKIITNTFVILLILVGLVPLPFFSSVTDVFAQDEITPEVEPALTEVESTETVTQPVEQVLVEQVLVEIVLVEEPVTEEALVEEPVVEEALVEEPVVEDALAQEPVVEEALIEEPVVEEALVVDLESVVEELADAGLVMVDENQEPISLASTEAVQILTVPDPYFTRGGVIYRYLTDCAGYPVNCTVSTNPIQAAIDDVAANGLPDDGTIYVEKGIYEENLTIATDNLTLYGDPGNLTVSGAGLFAPTLEGTNVGGDGITIQGVGISIIGFIIQNFNNGIVLQPSGNSSFTAENNTIQNNVVAVYNKNAVPGINLHYNDFNNNTLAIKNDDVRGLQYIEAQNNYWGCPQGPIVQYVVPTETKYVLWSTKTYIDPANYPGCEFLNGENSKWNHQIQTSDYSPFKINLGTLAGNEVFGCTDINAYNYNADATLDDSTCEYEQEPERFDLLLGSSCTVVNGTAKLAWQINNPNSFNVQAQWVLDGSSASGTLAPGTTFVGYTDDGSGSHSLNATWSFGKASATSVLCPPVTTSSPPSTPETPSGVAAVFENFLIPVTGADFGYQALIPFGGTLVLGISFLVKGIYGKIKK